MLGLTDQVAFAKYFSTSANLSANAWDNAATLDTSTGGGSLTTCGSCDNCTRNEQTIAIRDVTLDSWKLLKVLDEVNREGGRATVGVLGELARGLGGGAFTTAEGKKGGGEFAAEGKKGKAAARCYIDLETVGGKVKMTKDVSHRLHLSELTLMMQDIERLIIHLTLTGYLQEGRSCCLL